MAARPRNDPLHDPLLRGVPEHDGYKVMDRCVLYSTLGSGGFGVVYKGRHLTLGVDVAVKCLKRDLAGLQPQLVERFQREAQQAAQINHPNVVRVFDTGQQGELHYLVMEYVEGETSAERVARTGPLPVDMAVEIVLKTAHGLGAMHNAGLIHRDVKPENVLISKTGEVKLADMGLAKPLDASAGLTLSHQLLGTIQYMSPEQCRDSRGVEASADVYSLGATLYFLLTGRDGIEAGDLLDVLERIHQKGIPSVRLLRRDVPEALAQLIADCTQQDALARPANGAELARQLEEFAIQGDAGVADSAGGILGPLPALVSPPPVDTLNRISLEISHEERSRQEAERRAANPRRSEAASLGHIPWPRGPRGRIAAALSLASVLLLLLQYFTKDGAQAAGPQSPASNEPSSTFGAKGEPSAASSSGTNTLASNSTPVPTIEIDLDPAADGRVHMREQVLPLGGIVQGRRAKSLQVTRRGLVTTVDLADDGGFYLPLVLLDDSTVRFELFAEGMQEPLELEVVCDRTPPELELHSPGAGANIHSQVIAIEVSARDAYLEKVTVDGRWLERAQGDRWRAEDIPLLREGPNTLVLVASDLAGNETMIELNLRRHTRPPELLAMTPAAGSALEQKASHLFELEFDKELESARLNGINLATDARTARGRLTAPEGRKWRLALEATGVGGSSFESQLNFNLVAPLGRAPAGWIIHTGAQSEGGWAQRIEDPDTGVVFRLVEGGSFQMGSPQTEPDRTSDEGPQRQIDVPTFYLAETELSAAQLARIDAGSAPANGNLPAEGIDWQRAKDLCENAGYRLPSEAEWEYACRAGSTSAFAFGLALGAEQANVSDRGDDFDRRNAVAPVGSYAPNAWGFFDMHGNVYEWCADVYDERAYEREPSARPVLEAVGPEYSVDRRVMRGGDCTRPARYARSAARLGLRPESSRGPYGLRPAMDLPR